MTTTLTQMARAHYEAMTRVDIHPLTPWAKWDELPESVVAEKLANMRAALEALREPSGGQLKAMRKRLAVDMLGEHMGPSAENTWKAAIDHALNEKGKEDG